MCSFVYFVYYSYKNNYVFFLMTQLSNIDENILSLDKWYKTLFMQLKFIAGLCIHSVHSENNSDTFLCFGLESIKIVNICLGATG